MFEKLFPRYKIILASQSPRRRQLLEILGWSFKAVTKDVDETIPEGMKRAEAARYLAEHKSDHFLEYIDKNTLVITADTIVCLDDSIINKPVDAADAKLMLRRLSGRKHDVFTAVYIRGENIKRLFDVKSSVYFKELSDNEINYYVEKYSPLDKAGAYGIQEWIGLIGIERIEGSYFNVMGLPVKELSEEILSL